MASAPAGLLLVLSRRFVTAGSTATVGAIR